MHARIRKYKTDSPAKVTRLVKRNLYLASRSSLAFWLINGDGILASVSVFETKGRAEESNRMAARRVKESLPGLGSRSETGTLISLLKRRKMEAMGLLLKAGQTDFLGTYSTGNATAITSV